MKGQKKVQNKKIQYQVSYAYDPIKTRRNQGSLNNFSQQWRRR